MIRMFLYWLPALLYMALIFYMSGHPAPQAAREVPIYYDIKIVHIVEYGILSALIFFAINGTTSIPLAWKLIYSVMLTNIYGLTDELHQVFIPERSAKLIDTAANIIGSIIFQAGIWVSIQVKRPISLREGASGLR